MKISEMNEDQLRDYALELEGKNKQLADDVAAAKTENEELSLFNKQLQRRNNELFLKVEQQVTSDPAIEPDPKPNTETCEEFARKLIIGG